MPTYEYSCQKCGVFEKFQRMTDSPLSECPTCHGPVQKKISRGGGFIFNGSGFYTTDYRKPEYVKRATEESGKTPEKAEATTGETKAGGSTTEKGPTPATEKPKSPDGEADKAG